MFYTPPEYSYSQTLQKRPIGLLVYYSNKIQDLNSPFLNCKHLSGFNLVYKKLCFKLLNLFIFQTKGS